MRRDGSRIVLACTGREFCANQGILGLACDDGAAPLLAGGYDDLVEDGEHRLVFWESDGRTGEAFTPEERREIGETMLAVWTRWMRAGKVSDGDANLL